MKSIRKRIFLMLVLILSQLAAWAVLVGILWFVKVKETMMGRVVFSMSDGRTVADISLSSRDAFKVNRGSIIFGDTSTGSFKARVLQRYGNVHGVRLCTIVLRQNPHNLPLSHFAKPMDISMWTRTRRALTILLDRSTLQQSRTEKLEHQSY